MGRRQAPIGLTEAQRNNFDFLADLGMPSDIFEPQMDTSSSNWFILNIFYLLINFILNNWFILNDFYLLIYFILNNF